MTRRSAPHAQATVSAGSHTDPTGTGRRPAESRGDRVGILPLMDEGDSYGSRRGVFCFVADCLPGELR